MCDTPHIDVTQNDKLFSTFSAGDGLNKAGYQVLTCEQFNQIIIITDWFYLNSFNRIEQVHLFSISH